ncbi:MAG: SDR family NAD(P)-dependent oxidoreductase [Rhodanobacteraceae bacterium]
MQSMFLIGVGPGIGTAVARRFAREGFALGLVARSRASVDNARRALVADAGRNIETLQADAGNEQALKAALDGLRQKLGVPHVVVYNAGVVKPDTIFELSHAERAARYATNVLGALTTMAHMAPQMAQAGGGTILVTSGMPKPDGRVVSLSIDKAGLRAAVSIVAAAYAGQRLHVATVTVGGPVAHGTRFDPDEIAAEYWRTYRAPPEQWQPDVVYWGNPDAPAIKRAGNA